MGRGDGRTLGQRVGSTFENGFGDEGWDAKIIHGVIMAFVIVLSVPLWLLYLPVWLVKRTKRLVTRGTTPPADDDTDERPV